MTQRAILSFFERDYFTSEHLTHLREEYFTGQARNAFKLAVKEFNGTPLNWPLLATKAEHETRMWILMNMSGIFEVDFSSWLIALKDEYLARELDTAKSKRYDHGIDAVYEMHKRTGDLLDNVKSIDKVDMHERFLQYLEGQTDNPVSTGYPKLDEKIFCGGFFPGQFIVIGGDPGTGKTSLMLNMAYNQGKTERVDFFSYELLSQDLHRRLVAAETCIPGDKIKRRNFSAKEKEDCIAASKVISDSKLQFKTSSGLSDLAMSIVTSDAQIIYVDYMQRIPMNDKRGQTDKISEISNTLNAAIKKTGKTLCIASSLNNDAMKSTGDPQVTDYKGSGDIGFDADIAMTLKFNGAKENEQVKVFAPKNRDGVSGFVSMTFRMPIFRYYETDEIHVPQMPYTAF